MSIPITPSTPPTPLAVRLDQCQRELEDYIKQRGVEKEACCWLGQTICFIKLLSIGGLAAPALTLLEAHLIVCHQKYGTTLDLRGIRFVKVYELLESGKLGDVVLTVFCYIDHAPNVAATLAGQYPAGHEIVVDDIPPDLRSSINNVNIGSTLH